MRCLVRPDTSDLNTHVGVGRTTLGEGVTDDGHRMVAPLYDEHSDQFFNTVDDKVSAEFFCFLLDCGQLRRREAMKVATSRSKHNWNISYISVIVYPCTVVDFEHELDGHVSSVGDVTLPCL